MLVIGLWPFSLPDSGRVTGLAHRVEQGLRIDLAEQFDVRTFVGQIDADAAHAWDFAQGAFDATDAGRAGHAVDAQFDGLPGHAVTGALHGLHQRRQAVAGRLYPRLFGGEVDTDGTGAADLAQRSLDTPGATGTGHAGNRQIESGGFGHRSRSL